MSLRRLAIAFVAAFPPVSPAADIVISPPATGGVSFTNATGATTRLRVGDDGIVTLPGLGTVPAPATGLCLEAATGRLGTCSVGTLTSLIAGTGLTGGTITGAGTIGLAPTQLLPTTACATNQIPKWSGTAWACATESGGGGGNLSGATAVLTGNLELVVSTPTAGNILKGGARYIHSIGGDFNFHAGVGAGGAAASATGNTAVGGYALAANGSGGSNTAIGAAALGNASNGSFNVMVGSSAGQGTTIGDFNTIVGTNSFGSTTTAFSNTGVGGGVLNNVTSGNGNIALGFAAGDAIDTGSNNIVIGNNGNPAESGVIRIGNFLQSKAFMAGIRGVTTDLADAIPVVVSSTGQLGTASSSRRVKQDIEDMGEASGVLMALRPVTFRYRSQAAAGQGALQYGLVAEEVAEAAPGLAVRSADGRIETVNYPALVPMLLNELQKQQRVIDAQAQRLERLEAALGIR